LVNSVTLFLAIFSFLELGVGSVVQSSLYKPLAENDSDSVSGIIVSANKFFRLLALILAVYIGFLIAFYPKFIHSASSFSFFYVVGLILAMSISFFAQYYFGVVDRLLLLAAQKGYVSYIAQTVTLCLSTAVCVILIKTGAGIQTVKLAGSLIYLLRPIYLRLYVNKHYRINRRIRYEGEPIKQKWNGVAQHVAAVVLDNTDTVVLTVFSTLSNVSIYSVYHLVINGVKTLFTSMTGGIQALLGELWAKQELDELKKTFSWAEWLIHTGAVLVFGCTSSLVSPFVKVYTDGITDADYHVPLFAFLLTLANSMHSLRLPYSIMILAGGHYKQTQSNYIIAAVMNLAVSILAVRSLGLIGVAIGTLAAMLFQTVWMAHYVSRTFLRRPAKEFVKHLLVDAVCFAAAYGLTSLLRLKSVSYLSWVVLAVECAAIWLGVIAAVNFAAYPAFLKDITGILKKRIGKAARAVIKK
ncbi:MAG: polysaccharide biosynthesis C-terminal domain-containing protein, partial [Oscillospiraceae bacterium]|nr:polysaccharide biosynthesis C-terminal domain-containing protein [Oscillospiraceae bacterium]